jgi:ABC-type branched-subunit amino acid transport system substrate-binding protein
LAGIEEFIASYRARRRETGCLGPCDLSFFDNFRDKYEPDAPVTAAVEAAYFQLHMAMRALARCGSDAPEGVESVARF